jgi:hypothetical protein
MRPPRLVEQDDLFAGAVADARREEPPRELMKTILEVHDARKADAASRAALTGSRRWVAVAVLAIGGAALLSIRPFERRGNDLPQRDLLQPAPAASGERGAPSTSALSPALADPATALSAVSIDDLPDLKLVAKKPAPAARPIARREIELITRAREALTRGDTGACIAAVNLHDREFPNGRFGPEATVMRIEALAAAGDREGARARAEDFLGKNPSSLYEPRVRSLLAAMGAK